MWSQIFTGVQRQEKKQWIQPETQDDIPLEHQETHFYYGGN